MRSTYIWATTIAVFLTVWLVSGQINSAPVVIDPSIAEQNRIQEEIGSDTIPTRVRAGRIRAVEKIRYTNIRGKTQNKRTVNARAELVGRVVERRVERGDVVAADAVLCELSMEDRQTALIEAQELVSQARIDYQGALKLEAKGFNSDSAIAATKARLASTVAQLKRRQLNIEKTLIRAPFAGVVEDVHVEIGDYVNPGQGCATIVDLNPMLMVGRVSEKDVLDLKLGELATGILADGRTVQGPVTFVGQQSDPQTRTYAVELQLDNADGALRSGITAEIKIPVDRVLAQRVSPALFALDDRGGIGIRVLDSDNIVLSDPSSLFASELYESRGSILWMDFWRGSAAPDLASVLGAGAVANHTHESGQMVMDKKRTWEALRLALFFNAHADVFYPLTVNYMGLGDKEIVSTAFLHLRAPYGVAPHGPDHVGVRDHDRAETLGNTMMQHDMDGTPMFLHANLGKPMGFVPADASAYVRRWQISNGLGLDLPRALNDAAGTEDFEMWYYDLLRRRRCWFDGRPAKHWYHTLGFGPFVEGFHVSDHYNVNDALESFRGMVDAGIVFG